ncbi:copper chaperone PCu(A)C [Rickettsia prowazekii]|uniref:Copper(I)-binding protein n=1 Tax=Rickettsia prowazekii (strain Rp22) TaxID=449216 RepID=D5AXH1_RICPP|nr:copper chaperone PCu(A)C [Rickettsia prowazekii]ADE30110.1 Exported protein of unknown function [Rickettsia prowazekii str. Rp22]AFE49375.1 copper(I)-binding protein [Rickettsia prowazekii str. Chernikova]AFE51902.1 copper(I)-binding protein [Rickettsia prowazekii str. Dachau]AGJ02267.1 hypothetical protein H375_410 [Rickettsia prowazekii str. Breinl]AMS12464.1 hypothetical protein AR462_02905 [Rickettsia prowazekii]
MLKTVLVSFINLICALSYADQTTQNPNLTSVASNVDVASTDDLLPAEAAVHFVQPWARPTINVQGKVSNSAMYFTLINTRNKSYQLVNISSDKIGGIEIHQTINDQGVNKMVKVDYPFLISGNINVDFKPGSRHIMLYDPKVDLNAGDEFQITFFFDDNTQKIVNVKVANDNPYNKIGN